MKQTRGLCRIFISGLAAMLVFVPFGTRAADLNSLLDQKNQIDTQIKNNQAAADNKAREAQTLSTQISNIDRDISSAEQKIADTGNNITAVQATIDSLSTQIEAQTKALNELKAKLNSSLVEIYRSSTKSDFEVVLGATSLSETSNENSYLQIVEMQVKILHDKVSSAKTTLESQKSNQEKKKAELDDLRKQQETYKKNVEYQKNTKSKLLNMTVAQKQEYETKIQKLKTEMTQISAAIYAERQKRLTGGRETLVGGSSGYPYGSIDEPDAWGFLTRECTSYAAWYLNVMEGKDFVNTRPGSGSAYNWPNLARDQGLTVSSSPRVGAAISWAAGSLTSSWGHVAIVEAVNSDGTIDISEYNWIKYSYSYRSHVRPGDYGSYSYIY